VAGYAYRFSSVETGSSIKNDSDINHHFVLEFIARLHVHRDNRGVVEPVMNDALDRFEHAFI